MAKKKIPEPDCNFLILVPRSLRMNFREACYKRGITAKSAVMLFMWATIRGEVVFNKSLKFSKKSKLSKKRL